jgi:hypothetical protein
MLNSRRANADLLTAEAVAYCLLQGRKISASGLQKMRSLPIDSPRDCGPNFYRDAHGRCWYPVEALDRWVKEWRSRRIFRGVGRIPPHFTDGRAT